MRAIIATGIGKLHFHESARALAKAGVEVNFLTGWLPSERQASLVDLAGDLIGEKHLAKRLAARRIGLPGVAVTSIVWTEVAAKLINGVERTGAIPLDTAYGWQCRVAGWGTRKYLKNADVLLVRSGAGQGGAIKTARRNGLAIVTDHSIAHPAFIHEELREEFNRFALPVGYDPKADLWKLVLRDCADADLLLVNSDFVKRTFIERQFPADRIRVAYLGVREEFIGLKREYGIEGPVKILFTGNFDLRKGARILLEAIRTCRRGGLDVRLNLIGNLSDGERCLEAGDASFITHTPFVPPEELMGAFAAADLFVLPTFAEGSSRSAMEAAAAGMPLITTERCGLPLEHNSAAFYVPPGDVCRLADAIAQLASNGSLRASLGQRAAQTIAASYTWSHYGHRLAAVLKEAIDVGGSHPRV